VNSTPIDPTDEEAECELEVNGMMKIQFTGTTFNRIHSATNYCWANNEVINYKDNLPKDVIFQINNCGSIQATDPDGNVATRELTRYDASTRIATWKTSYNGKSCILDGSEVKASEKVCKESYAAFEKFGGYPVH